MSGPQFTQMIRDRIHECAPDHSVETITVGALRKAADDMAELYEALIDARAAIESLDEDALGTVPAVDEHTGEAILGYPIKDELLSSIDAALAKARGEQP